MDSLVFDAFEFCRLRGRMEGVIRFSDLPRLADETVDSSGELGWSIEGLIDERGNLRLHLSISGKASLACQRCLQLMSFDLVSDSHLALAHNEAAADEIDILLIDEDVEVIVGSASLDLKPIIEDEALLALPVSPRHEVCPELPLALSSNAVVKESPFAVLKNLKK